MIVRRRLTPAGSAGTICHSKVFAPLTRLSRKILAGSDPSAAYSAALRRDQRRLPGMAGIALFDGDDDQQTCLIIGHAAYIRHPGPLEVIPNIGGANQIVLRAR